MGRVKVINFADNPPPDNLEVVRLSISLITPPDKLEVVRLSAALFGSPLRLSGCQVISSTCRALLRSSRRQVIRYLLRLQPQGGYMVVLSSFWTLVRLSGSQRASPALALRGHHVISSSVQTGYHVFACLPSRQLSGVVVRLTSSPRHAPHQKVVGLSSPPPSRFADVPRGRVY